MSEDRMGAIVLATSDTGFSHSARPGERPSSLVEIGGEPLVGRVIRACRESGIGSILLIGGDGAHGAPFGADRQLAPGATPADDMRNGLAALDGCDDVVVVPGDIPFATDAEIHAFIASARQREAQLAYPLIERACYEAAFPELRRTYFRVKEGEVTGGNALFLNRATFAGNAAVFDQAMELRSEPWKLMLMVNPLALLAYRSGGISLREVEKAVHKALGIRASALIIDAPGLASDVRQPIDLRYARKVLGEGG